MVNYVGLIALLLVVTGGVLPWWSISGEYLSEPEKTRIMSLSLSYSPYLLGELNEAAARNKSPPEISAEEMKKLDIDAALNSPMFQRQLGWGLVQSLALYRPPTSTGIIWLASMLLSLLLYVVSLPILLVAALRESSKKGQKAGGILAIFTVAIFVFGLNSVGLVTGSLSETLTSTQSIHASWRLDIGIFLIAIGAAISFATPYVILPTRKEGDLQHSETKARHVEEPEKAIVSEAVNESPQKFCINCGTRIVKAAKYCPKCGEKQE
ncbi:MAG: zinc ribbon domain-containing protein [Thaumarchaeota archaeon]|nr:zinc ribbon domain-containing protein [Nitrososphaerota archaeon]